MMTSVGTARQQFEQEGIELSSLVVRRDTYTGVALIMVDHAGENWILPIGSPR